jgi:uncharacterized protein
MIMLSVIYLHGLESGQGGEKVEFLTANSMVYAPDIDYKNFTYRDFKKLIQIAQDCDLIIGSSAGGYLANIIATHVGCDVLLFNPAFHSRSFELDAGIKPLPECTYYERTIVLGLEDDVIDPVKTKEWYVDEFDTVIEIESMGHRTPLNVFKDIYTKYFC